MRMHLDSDCFMAVVGDVQLCVCGLANRTVQHNTVHRWGALSHSSQDKHADVSITHIM